MLDILAPCLCPTLHVRCTCRAQLSSTWLWSARAQSNRHFWCHGCNWLNCLCIQHCRPARAAGEMHICNMCCMSLQHEHWPLCLLNCFALAHSGSSAQVSRHVSAMLLKSCCTAAASIFGLRVKRSCNLCHVTYAQCVMPECCRQLWGHLWSGTLITLFCPSLI